jgi:hypothetical protein
MKQLTNFVSIAPLLTLPAQRPPPIPNIEKMNRSYVSTCSVSNRRAQNARKPHLATLQEIEKQYLFKKQERDKEQELEEKQCKDAAIAKQALTKQATKPTQPLMLGEIHAWWQL